MPKSEAILSRNGDFTKPNVPTESLPEEDQRHLFD